MKGSRPLSGPGSALVVITAGATAALQWYCVDQFGYLCAGTTAENWSASAPGVGVGFSSTVTTGAGPTIEYFSTTTSTPPGNYPGTTCITSYTGTNCVYFVIQVVSATNQPVSPPTFSPSQAVKIQIGPVLINPLPNHQVQITGYGHLYIELYVNGSPQQGVRPYQAGPLVTSSDTNSYLLGIQEYSQSPLTDPSVDITAYTNAGNLTALYNNYLYFQSQGYLPYYSLLSLNSNSWVDGMLLSAGISQSTIDGWVSKLQFAAGENAIAYGDGSLLQSCFQLIHRPPPARRLPRSYGGCVGD